MKSFLKSLCLVFATFVLLAGCTKESAEKQILRFEFAIPAAVGTINENDKTVEVIVPIGTDLTNMVPVITISSKATVNPASGTIVDFTNPVTFTVTAEDGSQAVYKVKVTYGSNGGGGGTQNTTKKIQKVYYSYQSPYHTDPKALLQQWNWSAEGSLNSIENYDPEENIIYFLLNFTYDLGRLTRIDCFKYNFYVNYTYGTDNLLNKLDLYLDNKWAATCDITYASGNIELLKVTIFDDDVFLRSCQYLNPFSVVFPEQICNNILKFEQSLAQHRNGNDEEIHFTLQLTWNNNNITKIYGSGMGEMITIEIDYDNNNSFVYGFLLGQYNTGSLVKNNPTKIKYTESYKYTEVYLLEYVVDDTQYPTQITEYDGGSPNYKTTLYIEY